MRLKNFEEQHISIQYADVIVIICLGVCFNKSEYLSIDYLEKEDCSLNE